MTATVGLPIRRQTDRLFFTGMALASLLTMLVGFAPTYFIRGSSLPPLSLTYQVHGAIFTAWIVLLVVQVALVARRRTDIHRSLGLAGAVLAAVLFVVGVMVSVETLRRGGGAMFAPPSEFFAIPLGDMIVFGTLAAAAVTFRHDPDTHKRLMLLATISILTAAIARLLVQLNVVSIPAFFLATDVFVLAVILYDFATRGRIHPATLWGALAVVAFKPLLFAVSGTSAWLAFANMFR
jgi:FtsH-binding integral membrane protein